MFSVFTRSGDWKTFYKNAPVTSILIIINTVMLVFTMVTGGFDAEHLAEIGGIYYTYVIDNNEWWRIITAAFLHGGIVHYLSNMIIGLLTLSSALERLIGSKKFSIVYFGSLILSGLATVFFSNQYTVTIGASGAIFGALGCLLFITFYKRDMLSPQDIQSIRGLIFVNIIFTFLGGNISIPGHIGGIVSGFLLSFLILKKDKPVYYDSFNTFNQNSNDVFNQPTNDDDNDDVWH